MKRILGLGALLALFFLNGCTADKKIAELTDLIKKLEARIEAIEKIVLPPKEEPVVQQNAYDVPVGDSPVLGNKDAKVNIVVFSNFQCPYCARADKALREVIKDETLKDKVNIVFKNFPFERHTEARPAAKAALAAQEQGKFWEMSEKIFANQNDMNEKNYQKWAKELGLDIDKFDKDRKDNDQKYNDMIDRDIKLGAENAKLEGTPWILVGGWLLEGEISPAVIKKMLEDKKLI